MPDENELEERITALLDKQQEDISDILSHERANDNNRKD